MGRAGMLPTHVCVAGLVCAPSPQCSSPPVYFYPKDSPTRERYSLVLCVTNLGKQGNVSVQHLPQKITGSYQFWGYKALLFQGPYVLACSLLIFGLFVFISVWNLHVRVSAVYLQFMPGYSGMILFLQHYWTAIWGHSCYPEFRRVI